MTEEAVRNKLDYFSGKLDKQLVQLVAGVSPLFAKEAVYQAGLANRETLPKSFLQLLEKVKQHAFQPQMIITEDNKEQFYFMNLEHLKGERKHFPTLSELLDRFYFGKASRDRVKQQANDLDRYITNEIQKNEKKILKLEQTLIDAKEAEKYQLYGELLTANLYQISRGDKEVTVTNYYDENGGSITIRLDVQKSPSANAQAYFNKYQKQKFPFHCRRTN